MQLTGGSTGSTSSQVTNWTAGDVRNLINLVTHIRDTQDLSLNQQQTIMIMQSGIVLTLYFILFVLCMHLGYSISHYFTFKSKDLF